MDCTFTNIRTSECAVGNFLADIMRKELLADLTIMNSGAVRADRVLQPGYLTAGDFVDIDPFRLMITKVRVTGKQLLRLLEEGVSGYPSLEGRFPQVSGIRFEFDAKKPKYERVNVESKNSSSYLTKKRH